MWRDLARIVKCEAYSFMWASMGLVAFGLWSLGPSRIEDPIVEFGGFAALYVACNGVGILVVWKLRQWAGARSDKVASQDH
jgi:hypothetical protein